MARSIFARMILLATQLDHLGGHYLREHHPHPAPERLPINPARLAYARLPKQFNQTTLIPDDGFASPARFTLRPFRDSPLTPGDSCRTGDRRQFLTINGTLPDIDALGTALGSVLDSFGYFRRTERTRLEP
jgi:hypothetical protein